MFCKFCGNPIDDDSIFCIHCGFKQFNKSNAESFEERRDQGQKIPEIKKEASKVSIEESQAFTGKPRRYIEATIVGILVIIWSVCFILFYKQLRFSDQSVLLISIIIRIVLAIWSVNIAWKLNRSRIGWGLFTFIFPDFSLIIIGLLRRKSKPLDNLSLDGAKLNPRRKEELKELIIRKEKLSINKSKRKWNIFVLLIIIILIVLSSNYIYNEYFSKPTYPEWIGEWRLNKNIGNLILKEAKWEWENEGLETNDDVETFFSNLLSPNSYLEIKCISHVFKKDEYLFEIYNPAYVYYGNFSSIDNHIALYQGFSAAIMSDLTFALDNDKMIVDICYSNKYKNKKDNNKESKNFEIIGLLFEKR